MPPVATRFRAGQVAVEVHERRTGQMPAPIRLPACIGIGELVAAVDDDERRIVDVPRERLGRDKRGVLHRAREGGLIPARATPKAMKPRIRAAGMTSMR